MSQEQISSGDVKVLVQDDSDKKQEAASKPVKAEKVRRSTEERKARRQRRERKPKQEGEVQKKEEAKSAAEKPSKDEPVILVANRDVRFYVRLLRQLLKTKFDEIEIASVSPVKGNSKVIWIANRMVEWGYCTITKVRTQQPAFLKITVKK